MQKIRMKASDPAVLKEDAMSSERDGEETSPYPIEALEVASDI